MEVDVVEVEVLVDVLEDVVDELLVLVETFPGEAPNSTNAETATTARTATARTAPRFTFWASSDSPLKGSQVCWSCREYEAKAINV